MPVCLATVAWGGRLPLPAEPSTGGGRTRRGFPDPVGIALTAVVPALLCFTVVYGPRLGWQDPRVPAAVGAIAVLVLVLVRRSRRAARPALDPGLFRIRNFQASNVATLIFSVAFFAVLLSSLLFLQNVWHYSVLRAALAVSPSALVTALVAPQAGRLIERFGHRAVFTAGTLCYATGAAGLALRTGSSPHWTTHWLPTLLVNGVGVGLALSALNSAAAQALPPERFGVGTAVNDSFRQLGALLGVSVFAAVLGDGDLPAGYHRVWWVLAGVPVVAAVVYGVWHREREPAPVREAAGSAAS